MEKHKHQNNDYTQLECLLVWTPRCSLSERVAGEHTSTWGSEDSEAHSLGLYSKQKCMQWKPFFHCLFAFFLKLPLIFWIEQLTFYQRIYESERFLSFPINFNGFILCFLIGSLSKFALPGKSEVASSCNTSNTNIFQNYAMEVQSESKEHFHVLLYEIYIS